MSAEQAPVISLVVVAHERPDWLQECLESIVAQSFADFECIVVLDHDPEGALADSGRQSIGGDPRFRFLSQARRVERNHCRNQGIDLARGRWLAIADGDDWLPPDSLAVRLATAEANPDHVVFGRVRNWQDGQPGAQLTYQNRYTFRDLRIGWPSHCTLLIDRHRLGAVRYPGQSDDGDRDPAELAGEDVRFLHELLQANPGVSLLNCRENVYYYRRHSSSSQRQRHRAYLCVIRVLLDFHGYPKPGDLKYRDSLTEKALYCLFHHAMALQADGRLARIGDEAEPELLAIAAWINQETLERVLKRVAAETLPKTREEDGDIEAVRTAVVQAIAMNRLGRWTEAMPGEAIPYDPAPVVPDFRRVLRWQGRHRGATCVLWCGTGDMPRAVRASIARSGVKVAATGGSGGVTHAQDVRIDYQVSREGMLHARHASESGPDHLPVHFVVDHGGTVPALQDPLTFRLPGKPRDAEGALFSTDITRAVRDTQDLVVAALQVLYYLGFQRVILAGLEPMNEQPDVAWAQREAHLAAARTAFEADGRTVVNTGPEGFSVAFHRQPLAQAIAGEAPPPASHRRITLFPAFEAQDDLDFSLVRVAWYLGAVDDARIRVFADGLPDQPDCLDCYDPDCATRYGALRAEGRLVCEPPRDARQLLGVLRESDAVVCWKDGANVADVFGIDVQQELQRAGTRIFNMGASERLESSMYVEVSYRLMPDTAQVIETQRQRFAALRARLGGREKAFLVATGPSSQSWNRFALEQEQAVTLVCNSVINDAELMDALSPDVVLFADPIFHFGCSTYARAFRQQLREMAARHRFTIVIPLRYLAIFKAHLPELAHRVIAIPHDHRQELNLDLGRRFKLRATDNILTFLMLPLAASLARHIYVIGCDGRPLDQDDYFWSHNQRTQFSAEMAAIRRAHPSFFTIDYNDYYLGHCETLEQYAQALEQRGQALFSMWGSHIPALRARWRPPAPPRTGRVIVSLNPDLRTEFGHWLNYDRQTAATTDDLFVTLAHRELAINPPDFLALPVFSHAMREIRVDEDGQRSAVVREEFRAALYRLLAGLSQDTQVHCLAYTGDPGYIDALEPIFEAMDGRVHLALNLFYTFLDFQVGLREFVHYADRYRRVLDPAYLAARPWLHLFTDTERMQRALQQSFGTRVALWPMVNLDATDDAIRRIPPRAPSRERRIVFPGNGQLSKGFDLACDFIETHGPSLAASHGCRFVIRDMARDRPEINEELERRAQTLRDLPCVEVHAGTLDIADYLALFWHADIVVLPYRRRHFYARTSACVVNALIAGRPTLVPRDTWLSEQVQKFHGGDTFLDGDIDDLRAALVRMLDDSSPPAIDSVLVRDQFEFTRLLPTLTGSV